MWQDLHRDQRVFKDVYNHWTAILCLLSVITKNRASALSVFFYISFSSNSFIFVYKKYWSMWIENLKNWIFSTHFKTWMLCEALVQRTGTMGFQRSQRCHQAEVTRSNLQQWASELRRKRWAGFWQRFFPWPHFSQASKSSLRPICVLLCKIILARTSYPWYIIRFLILHRLPGDFWFTVACLQHESCWVGLARIPYPWCFLLRVVHSPTPT